MNKYLISFVVVCSVMNAYAVVPTQEWDSQIVAQVCDYDYINLQEIKDTPADKYQFSNSVVYVNDLSDWQDWNANVEFLTNVSLRVKNLDMSHNGEKLEHVSSTDYVNVSVRDADNLYRVDFTAIDADLFLDLVRETDYTKVFQDGRGSFLQNIRAEHSDDKMLFAMDRASSMQELNSVMNNSYHFNQLILMRPIKTVNRAALLNFLSESNVGIGVDIDYILSDKIDNYAGHIYFADKYDDLFFKIAVDLNRFSYSDNFNDFDGLAYGLHVGSRKYFHAFWLDGILGINRANFNADNVYVNNGNTNNPKGVSEYTRLSVGYDYKHVSDVVISPFAGLLFQNVKILDVSENEVNLHAGLIGKYGFILDGMKYEYGASVAIDDEANLDLGVKVGFLSVVDNAGAHLGFNVFQDDFGTNYKLSVNANLKF